MGWFTLNDAGTPVPVLTQRVLTMSVTPIHLTGAKCGDDVYRRGAYFGRIYRWTREGASVHLADGARVLTDLGFHTDAVVLTNEDFASDDFEVITHGHPL